jgi:hypothetical protein
MMEHIKKQHVELLRSPPYPYAPLRLAEYKFATTLTTYPEYPEIDNPRFASCILYQINTGRLGYSPLFAEFIARTSTFRLSDVRVDRSSLEICQWANSIHIGTFDL